MEDKEPLALDVLPTIFYLAISFVYLMQDNSPDLPLLLHMEGH